MLSSSLKRPPNSLPYTGSQDSLSLRLGWRIPKPKQVKQQLILPVCNLHAPKTFSPSLQMYTASIYSSYVVCHTRVTQKSKPMVLTAHKALGHCVSSEDGAGAQGACLLQRSTAPA